LHLEAVIEHFVFKILEEIHVDLDIWTAAGAEEVKNHKKYLDNYSVDNVENVHQDKVEYEKWTFGEPLEQLGMGIDFAFIHLK
jgi:hypothetical protein